MFIYRLLIPLLSPSLALAFNRKSIAFGPDIPHAVFNTTPHLSPLPADDPFTTAIDFISQLLAPQLSPFNSFVVREDSYTDVNTGVSHIYIRQIINGLEVADGDINLNVLHGRVLSYGNSFYTGQTPLPFRSPGDHLAHTHLDYCTRLTEEHAKHLYTASQTPLALSRLPTLALLRDWHCDHAQLPYTRPPSDLPDARTALLHFMVAAVPDPSLAKAIIARWDEHLAGMDSVFESYFLGTHQMLLETIHQVPDAVSPVPARMVYVQVPNEEGTTELQLVWNFEVEMRDNWYEAAVSFQYPHRILSVVDWASDARAPVPPPPAPPGTYHIFPWGVNDPEWGNRTVMTEPNDTLASPAGWHALPYSHDPASREPDDVGEGGGFWRNTTTTWGNNVYAHENWEGAGQWIDNYRPDGGVERVFRYPYDPQPMEDRDEALEEARKYINLTVTQLFYTVNMVHDLFYRYGFDEVSGNFQAYNFGRGGKENDAVIANAQDGSGFNNANFMTPPDGQSGRCRMYVWNTANPYRDGDLEAGIVIHELGHGLSTRLTGGPANSGCLGWGESGGMGEGWGDFLATLIRSNKEYSDYPMGAWAANRTSGIRHYVYSVNKTVNPSMYKTLDKPGYWGVHAVGEVWAEMLWVVAQKLIDRHGYVDDMYPPPLADMPEEDDGESFYRPRVRDPMTRRLGPYVPRHGNSLAMQLVINAMKMQPCRPSFFHARDAILQADQVLTGGENFCDIWSAFAQRGLGIDAKVEGRTPWGGGIRTNGFEIPLACDPAE